MSDTDELKALRARILPDFHVRRGSQVWAPWGKSGWSAVEIRKPSRKWAKGVRVKPKTGKIGAEAKVPLRRLLRRDPDQCGDDKPGLSPDEVFAHFDELEQREASSEAARPANKVTEASSSAEATLDEAKIHVPEPDPILTPQEQAERRKRLVKLLDLLPDKSTSDDWHGVTSDDI